VRVLNAIAAATPRLSTAASRWKPARALMNAAFGFDARRSLPPFSESLFRWFEKRGGSPGGTKKVVLFGDCFSAYNESRIGKAAVAVLEACGYEVLLPRTGCCARPAISMGLLPQAISTIDRTMEQLRPFVEDASVEAILMLEPSCLSALKDDWQMLKVSAPKKLRRALAQKVMLVEDFVEKRWDMHPRTPPVTLAQQRVVLHGHCHQKAIDGVESSAGLLRRLAGSRLEVLDATCCGMAGMFGYTKDRYDVSMKVGEVGVLPVARQVREDEGEVILAPGTSCRHQIHDGAHRRALHPIEFAARAMGLDVEGAEKEERPA
jgi:Fe-S oxidoreductase